MSLTYTDEIKCPCGESFESELCQSVSVAENPELKEAVLAGELNIVKCPSCFQMLYVERFVLYHDAAAELLAFVYPKDWETRLDEIREQMGKSFVELQDALPEASKFRYKPFLVFGMDDLCVLIKSEEELMDEAAIVEILCDKLKLSGKKIHMDRARRLDIPYILPLEKQYTGNAASGPDFREGLIAGLKKVLAENPNLERYQKFLSRVENDAAWNLE